MSTPQETGRRLLPAIPRQPAGPAPEQAEWTPNRLQRAFDAFTGRAFGPYQAAVVRIGFGLAWAAFLLREWPNRRVLYGDRSPWSDQLAARLLAENHAFTVLSWHHGRLWFELVYHLAIVSAVLLMLGWRTRASGALFMVTVLSLQNRNVFVGDGGDNVVHLMAIYLVLTRCARVWSLDARRGREGTVWLWVLLGVALAAGPPGLLWLVWLTAAAWYAVNRWRPDGELRAVLDALANMLHNCAMLVIAAQVVLIYSTAGWYKVQGSRWQDGTALHYPLHLDYFTPWPWLSGLIGSSLLLVFLLSYGTVILQVAFPFTLVNRRLKNVLLALLVAEHLSIAVLLGLPFFSLAMIAADAVFLPTGALLWLGRRVSDLVGRRADDRGAGNCAKR
ncbi:HTTM domain-containing protein [Kitasatospora atroaurantiaca]|uniref:Vitamin K-dependent gamma-carboxylase-like protein n=1 Tax=Kitasatospora atroaurantiaca TaxID=285545 RepID=A0A561EST8_9ACTN|nr:HTTM domain-containing protein [Kitasatospora atroaurantiaca]TWE18674.1 vitamin K-dependent gamma-carboxylase-like protein [Kitasatospora atroaurantiaca]